MQKFSTLKSIPAYLPIVNIDTDMIIPKQFLKTIKRTGLGKNLFYEMRYDEKGEKINDFILNQNPFNNSKILIAGKNFGCGSSREHAPWALLDFGITCVISSSFADIFFNNCFKNGILPIILDEEKIKDLSEYADRKEEISVDLNEEKIIYGNNEIIFKVNFDKNSFLSITTGSWFPGNEWTLMFHSNIVICVFGFIVHLSIEAVFWFVNIEK